MTPPPDKPLPAAVLLALGLNACCLPGLGPCLSPINPCLSYVPDPDTDLPPPLGPCLSPVPRDRPDDDTGAPPLTPCLSIAPPPDPDPEPELGPCLSPVAPSEGTGGAALDAPDARPDDKVLDALPADVRERLRRRT